MSYYAVYSREYMLYIYSLFTNFVSNVMLYYSPKKTMLYIINNLSTKVGTREICMLCLRCQRL